MSKMTLSLSFYVLLIVAMYEPQCQGAFWQPVDSMICYRTVTLQLFENLKNVVDEKIYVERGEEAFKSKVKRSSFLSSIKRDDFNEKSQTQKVQEAQHVAFQGIFTVRRWLENRCTEEKRNKIMEITKIFKQEVAKCENPKYLEDSILRLEFTCPEKKKEETENNKPTYHWKSIIHDSFSNRYL